MNIACIPTAKDVYGCALTLSECQKSLASLNRVSCINVLALLKNMNELVFNKDFNSNSAEYKNHLNSLLIFLFDQDQLQKAYSLYQQDPEFFRPLSDQALIAALELACKYCSSISGSNLQTVQKRRPLIHIILSLHENMAPLDFPGNMQGWEDLTPETFAVFFKNILAHHFFDNYRFFNSRLYAIANDQEINDDFRNASGCSIDEWFQKRFFLSAEGFIICAFLMAVMGGRLKPENPDGTHLCFRPEILFKKLLNKYPKLIDFLDLASITPDDIAKEHTVSSDLYETLYKATAPIIYPIIIIGENRICFSNQLVLNKFLFGLPYLVQEVYKKEVGRELLDKEVSCLRSECGYLFEAYVKCLFIKWFSETHGIQTFLNYKIGKKGNELEGDILLIYKHVAYVFEIKSLLPTLKLRQTGDLELLVETLCGAVDQAMNLSDEINKGDVEVPEKIPRIERIVPCVITYGEFPITREYSHIIEAQVIEKLNRSVFNNATNTLPLQFFNISDLETAELYFDLRLNPDEFFHCLQSRALQLNLRYRSFSEIRDEIRDDRGENPNFLDEMAEKSRKYIETKVIPLLRDN